MSDLAPPLNMDLEELKLVCPAAEMMQEAGRTYFLLPNLSLPEGRQPAIVDGLLCINERDGYPTRLFLSAPITARGNNWNSFQILDRLWHAYSWKDVPSNQRAVQILSGHLQVLR